jgi:hypothetical protein
MKKNAPYTIVCSDSNNKFEATGPLLIQHFEEGIQRIDMRYNTLDASIDIYSLELLKIFDSQGNLKDEISNYKIYELSKSGPVLSVQNETMHGNYPKLSRAAFYIAMFDEYNQEITSWTPENYLSWDIENRTLTIL